MTHEFVYPKVTPVTEVMPSAHATVDAFVHETPQEKNRVEAIPTTMQLGGNALRQVAIVA